MIYAIMRNEAEHSCSICGRKANYSITTTEGDAHLCTQCGFVHFDLQISFSGLDAAIGIHERKKSGGYPVAEGNKNER